MTRNTGKSGGDRRIAHLSHAGSRLTVRLIAPSVSESGLDIRPDTPVIYEATEHIANRSVVVRGWLVPARFEVEGIGGLRVTFALASSNPLTHLPLVLTDLEVTHIDPAWRSEWRLTDLPAMSRLRDSAIALATVWVRRTPGEFPGNATSHRFEVTPGMTAAERRRVEREWRKAHGSTEVLGLAGAISRDDLARVSRGRRTGLPAWNSTEALREVARHYAEAYRDGGRPTIPIERYIGNRTHRAPGTVRRQITAARERGFIPSGIAPRRAEKSARKPRQGRKS